MTAIVCADAGTASLSMQLDVGPCRPDHSEFRKVGEDVLGAVKYLLCALAVQPVCRVATDSLEAALVEGLAALPEARRERYREGAALLLGADDAIRARVFGRHAAVPVERVREMGFDALLAATRVPVLDAKLLGMPRRDGSAVSLERLEAVWGPLSAVSAVAFTPELVGAVVPMTGGSSGTDPEVPFPGYYRKLEFSVRQIKCFDETNPEGWGDDDIKVSGTAVHTDGTVTQAATKGEYSFADGESKWLNWTFASFTRTKPKSGGIVYDTYGVFVALAEIDSGGFGKVLDAIYAKVQDKVKAAIATAVAGGASPFVGPFLGAVAGAVAAWLADKLIEWVISWFGDDLFPVKYVSLTGPRGFGFYPSDKWISEGPGYRSKDEWLKFYGHGGHYGVRYYWRVSDWINGSAPQ